MVEVEGIADWIGREVVDREGEKVGKLADVYYDTADSAPVFVSVRSGTFGRSQSVAPLQGATLARDYVRLDAPKELVKDAPTEEAGGRLTGVDALAVLAHYGLAPQPDLEGEERVCFQTAGAAEETERKRAELEAAQAREAEQAQAAEQDRETTAGVAAGSVAAHPSAADAAPILVVTDAGREAGPEPDRDLVDEDRDPTFAPAATPSAAADDDDPLRRLEQLERRVAALEARMG